MKKILLNILVLTIIGFYSNAQYETIPSTGLVERFTFHNTFTGSYGGTVMTGTPNYVTDRCGNANHANNFTTSGTFNNNSVASAYNSNRTFAFWYKSNSNTIHSLFNYRGAGNNRYFYISYENTPSGVIVVGTSEGSTSVPLAYTGGWTHIAVSVRAQNNMIDIYVNGTLVSSVFFGMSDITGALTHRIGRSPLGFEYANFQMDELLLYNRDLTLAEVQQIMKITAPIFDPAAPTSVCSGDAANLQVYSNGTVHWYSDIAGANLLGSGNPYTTDPVTTSSTFYFRDVMGTCLSDIRSVDITLNPPNADPVNTTPADSLEVCPNTTTTLSASGTDLSWYDVSNGGTALGSGTNFVTPVITANTTFYVQSGTGNCGSSRIAIPISVLTTVPAAPTSTSHSSLLSRCGENIAYLTATSTGTIHWYDVASGGTSLATGSPFISAELPNPSGLGQTLQTDFYAETVNACGVVSATRTHFPITINYRPQISTALANTFTLCEGESITLEITTDVDQSAVQWYLNLFTGLGTGYSYTTPPLAVGTYQYEAAASTAGGSCARSITFVITVTANSASDPINTTPVSDLTICNGASTTLTASGNGTLYWFDESTGGTQLGSGNSLNTGTLVSSKTFYVQEGIGGCASSRVSIPVTVTPVLTSTDIRSACAPFTWIDGNDYSADNTTATHTLQSVVSGCDSIVTLNLTVLPTVSGTDVRSECAPFTWIDGNDYSANNTTATHTLQSVVSGCDSVVTLNLTILPTVSGTDVRSECAPFTWIDGNDYSADNNTATHTLQSVVSGCDSIVTLNLTITTVNTIVSLSGSTLTANQAGATYQWINCDSNTPISGETAQTFTATVSGNYTVEITVNSCTETSACIAAGSVGVSAIEQNSWKIYPNPVNDKLFIESDEALEMEITDALGNVLVSAKCDKKQNVIDVSNFASGVYFLKEINTGVTQKFVRK